MTKTRIAPLAPPRPRALVASTGIIGMHLPLASARAIGTHMALAAAAMVPSAIQTRAPEGNQPQERGTPPPARGSRAASLTPSTYNATTRTVEAVFSAGTAVNRWYGTEALTISEEAIDLTRVAAGLCPLLNAHNQRDIDAVLGRVTEARIEDGQLVGTFLFADTEAGRAAEGRVARGELLGISVGYIVRTWTLTESTDERDTWTATRWELLEVSLVAVPADPNAGVRSAAGQTPGSATTTDNHEDDDMQIRSAGAGAGLTPPAAAAAADPQTRGTEPGATTTATEPAIVVTIGSADVRTAATNAGLDSTVLVDLLARHADQPFTRDTLMADIGRRFAERDSGAQTVNRVPASAGGNVTIARAMEDAVFHRMSPGAQLTEAGRNFRGMGMLRMAEELLHSSGINVRGMTPNEIAERALHTTSDFPALMSSAMNRRLRQAYEEHQPTYRQWARRAPNAPNFKSIDVVQMSAMPDLLKVNEAGEFRYGTASDGKVSYALISYGRIIGLSRQLIINDDLNGLDRAMTGFAAAGTRLENRTVYAQLTANAAFPDGNALFSAAHGNLGTGTSADVISATSLGAGRTRMRKQKGLQGEELNIAPAHLIVPSDLEQVAYQFTSSQYVPALAGDINEFRQGGRTALNPIVEPVLDGNSTTAWYLAANSSQIDTVEYAYLEGAEGVQLSSRLGFTVDGVEIKASLDFAASAIDWRGLDKNNGK